MEIANKKYGAKITEAVCITEARDIKTEEQRIVLQLAANNGKPLEPIEYGYAFKKLQAAGWSVARLNKEAAPGRSRQWIVDCLKLTEDPEAIQQAVKAGKIKAATAKKLRTADPQDKETALLKADLGQKVTGRDVDEAKEQRKAAKKPMESLKFDAGVFGDGLVSTFGFQKASDVPDYKGNCTIRIDQLDPLFIGVYVK
jgi:KorB domain.